MKKLEYFFFRWKKKVVSLVNKTARNAHAMLSSIATRSVKNCFTFFGFWKVIWFSIGENAVAAGLSLKVSTNEITRASESFYRLVIDLIMKAAVTELSAENQ